jgi:hypothetical protein
MEQEFQKLLSHFYQFAKSRIGFDKDASVNFVSDPQNSVELLGKTAYYDPSQMSVTIYTDRRHPKDILRSVAHELVHHKQNCDGKMDNLNPTTPGYAQEDSHLRGLEEEAYLEGNMCFRDWEDNYKTNQEVKTIYESVTTKFIKEKLQMSTKGELRNIVKEAVTKVLSENRLKEMDYGYEEDPYMDDLEKEFPFLKDDPEMGGRAPADVQRSMDDEMPMGMEDEDEMMEMAGCPHCDGNAPRSECICGKAMEEEVVAEGDEMSRTITQIEKIGAEISQIAKMSIDPAVVERIEMIDDMVTDVLEKMQGVKPGFDADGYSKMPGQRPMEEKTTDKHNDNPALSGDQKDELPDHLQKAIIDDAEEVDEEKLSAFQRDLRRRQAMKDAYDERMRKEKEEQDANEAVEDDITSSEDRYGDMRHILTKMEFTGDIETDVRAMEENEELADWLYGELGSGDVITDKFGTEPGQSTEYAGADVQDYLDTGDVELPDIAETQEDFYAQMRTDARTLSEDWNKSARNKRSALLNERLMKAWNFKK